MRFPAVYIWKKKMRRVKTPTQKAMKLISHGQTYLWLNTGLVGFQVLLLAIIHFVHNMCICGVIFGLLSMNMFLVVD